MALNISANALSKFPRRSFRGFFFAQWWRKGGRWLRWRVPFRARKELSWRRNPPPVFYDCSAFCICRTQKMSAIYVISICCTRELSTGDVKLNELRVYITSVDQLPFTPQLTSTNYLSDSYYMHALCLLQEFTSVILANIHATKGFFECIDQRGVRGMCSAIIRYTLVWDPFLLWNLPRVHQFIS